METRDELEWNHTASLVAMIHNVNCSKKSDMKNPDQFNPHRMSKRGSGAPIRTREDFMAQKELLKRQ